MSVSDTGRCRNCGARPRLQTDAEGRPLGIGWNHEPTCERPVSEERRLRALTEQRGENPMGLNWSPPTDEGEAAS